jgi:hypothetical protein
MTNFNLRQPLPTAQITCSAYLVVKEGRNPPHPLGIDVSLSSSIVNRVFCRTACQQHVRPKCMPTQGRQFMLGYVIRNRQTTRSSGYGSSLEFWRY